MKQVHRLALVIVLLLTLPLPLAAQTGPVSYTVSLDPRPTTHFLHVTVRVTATGAPFVDFAMPAWAPGAYSIQNAWRNVQEFSAVDGSGTPLSFEKSDKQTWRVFRKAGSSITARYKVFYRNCNDGSCFITGPSVFMYVIGKRPYPLEGPVTAKVDMPAGWRIQTGLEPGGDPTTFSASDFDTFIDASILAGPDWDQTEFDYKGVPHAVVFIGKGNYDKQKITADTKAVVTYFAEMMGGLPYKKYVFFLRARASSGAGGLEHLNSTDISFSAYNTHTSPANYSRFMFVVAHEYFHLWNVKRIRPAILGPFDYSREQNTRNLYVSEGMTSYWAAIGLARSGVWSRQDYYDEVAREVGTLQSAPGRKIMSVELSSWDTWNQGDNAANNRIDYYNKGELLGNILDLEIRKRTQDQRSLTDVFLYLFRNNGLPKPGFEEVRGFRDVVERIARESASAAGDFGDFFSKYVSGTEEIPWNAFLTYAGLELVEKKDAPRPTLGLTTGTSLPSTGFMGGAPTPLPAGQVAITQISQGSPAEEAGLDTGDVLVAMDGDRVDPATFTARLREKPIGGTIQLSVLRRDQLRAFSVRVGQEEPVTYSIQERKNPTEDQKRILSSWLGVR